MLKVLMHPRMKTPKGRKAESAKKLTIQAFEKNGHTSHSGMAMTLPFVINHCEENGIAYRLTAHPRTGYFIEKIRDPEFEPQGSIDHMPDRNSDDRDEE